MKKRAIVVCVAAVVLLACLILMKLIKTDDGAGIPSSAKLIYEETLSPNQDYVTDEADLVYYTIQVYQDKNNQIIVSAESNSAFFEPVQYEVDFDHEISEQDVLVKWMTLSGGTEPAESDQYGMAQVSILDNAVVVNEKVISFVSKGVKAITDVIG